MSRSPRPGRACLALALVAAAWAAVTVLSGGFTFAPAGLRLSSRDPLRPLLVCAVLLAAARIALGAPEFWRLVLRAVGTSRAAVAARIAGLAAVAVLVVAVAWNTRAAGGSDSSCYVLQAEAFAHGRATLERPLADVLPDATPATFAPTGFVPSPRNGHEPVPICGPGLALAMTLPFLVSRGAVFLVVPVCAALLVWLTFALGRQLDDEVTGACAAVLVASSPIFLYQSVQPMSDIPAAALWLAALTAASRAPAAAGVCVSLAILMRVNLAPLLPVLFLVLPDRRAWVRFSVAALPGLLLMTALNVARYGGLLASGYGSADVLFSMAHVRPNLARYPVWLVATETPFLLLALLAPAWMARHRDRARLAAATVASAVLVFATYLLYTVFDDWWYIRFLLPALPIALICGVIVALDRVPRARWIAALAISLVLVPWRLHLARERQVFDLQGLESRFLTTGRFAATLPPNAMVLAGQQSGSIRYHGGRPTLAWDAIPPDALDATLARLRAHGYAPYIALEELEEERFRARFAGQRLGGLDWPPLADLHGLVRVKIYDPSAR
jgi:dolichyl-phosphate-mannose-protein mannosyltransferase